MPNTRKLTCEREYYIRNRTESRSSFHFGVTPSREGEARPFPPRVLYYGMKPNAWAVSGAFTIALLVRLVEEKGGREVGAGAGAGARACFELCAEHGRLEQVAHAAMHEDRQHHSQDACACAHGGVLADLRMCACCCCFRARTVLLMGRGRSRCALLSSADRHTESRSV